MVVKEVKYVNFSQGNAKFIVPTNPGAYPTTVDVTNAVICEHQIAEHKAEIVAYETYLGVKNWLRRMIAKAIDHKWLAKLESETMGYNHLAPKDLLTHLQIIEMPASYFARGDRYEHQLLKVGQARNPELRLAFTLATFQSSSEFNPALREWDAKGTTDKTFGNLQVFMQAEFRKHHKQNKSRAKLVGHGIANSVMDKQVKQMNVI
ncbi:hypothetical protein ACHAW6_000244 [Cyclotella cf. meneghiniana]